MAEESPGKPRDFSRLPHVSDLEEPVGNPEGSSRSERVEYERARTDALEAETRHDREKERRERRSRIREDWGRFRHKKQVAFLLAVVLLAVGGTLYLQNQKAADPTPEPQITTTSALESAMKIGYLTTLKYDYCGIAEHHDVKKVFDLTVSDVVDYRVKYRATFSIYYDLEAIKFKKDADGKFIAYLPDPQISEPVVQPGDMGYLPDTGAQVGDVYDLCVADAAEADTSGMVDVANSGLEDIVGALATPLLTDDEGEHELGFDALANYTEEEVAENATD